MRVALTCLTTLALTLTLALGLTEPPTAEAASPAGTQRVEPAAATPAQARAALAEVQGLLKRRTPAQARLAVRQGRTDVTLALRDLFASKHALSGVERRQAEALLARPRFDNTTALLPGTASSPWCPTDGNFCLHWGPSLPGASVDNNGNGVPDYVEAVNATMEHVRRVQVDVRGYRAPLSDAAAASVLNTANPNDRFDVFLTDLGSQGIYGYCTSDNEVSRQVPAYCVLDDDFSPAQYGAPALVSLQATAAHEFFHAVQFGYDSHEDRWFMEGSATWMEGEVFDRINDNLRYLPYSALRAPRIPVDRSTDYWQYGAWLFFRYASERLRDPGIVRSFWEAADAARPTNLYSLRAIRVVVERRMAWSTFFGQFGAWNTLPKGSYRERHLYPAPVLWRSHTLTKRGRSTGKQSLHLPHLTSASYQITPGQKLKRKAKLRIEIDNPPVSMGSVVILQRRFRNGTTTHAQIRLNAAGDAKVTIGFNPRLLAKVVVIVANSSTQMTACTNFSPGNGYSCGGRGFFDNRQPFQLRATVR